jgi:hypothetical protein
MYVKSSVTGGIYIAKIYPSALEIQQQAKVDA